MRLLASERNRGPAAARNAAIAVANGKYITFLDADDEFLPGKVERQVKALEQHPDSPIVACDATWFDEKGRVVSRLFEGGRPVRGDNAWKTLLEDSFIATPCVMARRDAVVNVGAFDETLLIAQDQDLWIRLALSGAVEVVDEVLVRIST